MKLKMLHEGHDKWIYGYRSLPEGPISVQDAIKYVRQTSPHREGYFSFSPMFYNYMQFDGKQIGNIIEVRFNLDDPNLGGYGDSQPFYEWIIGLSDYPFQKRLPSSLLLRVKKLRQKIANDPNRADDWSFAGILPENYKAEAIDLYKAARKTLRFSDVIRSGDDEFNYIGPYEDHITGILIVEFVSKYEAEIDFKNFRVIDKFVSPNSKLKI